MLDERRARHAERRAGAARQAAALERITELEPRIAQLGTDELDELEQLAVVGHGDYTTAAFTLRGQVRARRQQLADAAASTAGCGDGGQDERLDDDASGTAPADVEPAAKDPDEPAAEDVDEPLAADDRDREQHNA